MAKPKHDSFFGRSLEHPAIARDFLKQHLPNHLKDKVIWESISRIDRTNTDPALERRHRDVIYKISLKHPNEGSMSLAIEHQSEYDPLIPARFLRYSADNLEGYLKSGNKKWPLLVNLLVYHGRKSPSPYACETSDYYEYPILGNQELWFRFHVIDLTQISDEEILTYGLSAPLEILLKHSREAKFELDIDEYREVFHRCVDEVGDDYIYSMLVYAGSLENFKMGEKIFKFVEGVFNDKPEIIMTYAQVLKKEARFEGVQEGIKEGLIKGLKEGMQTEKMQIAKSMLKDGESIEKIMKYTGLDKHNIQKLGQEKEPC